MQRAVGVLALVFVRAGKVWVSVGVLSTGPIWVLVGILPDQQKLIIGQPYLVLVLLTIVNVTTTWWLGGLAGFFLWRGEKGTD